MNERECHFATRVRNACDIPIQKFDVADSIHVLVNMGAVTIIGAIWYNSRTIYTRICPCHVLKENDIMFNRKQVIVFVTKEIGSDSNVQLTKDNTRIDPLGKLSSIRYK